MTTAVGVLVDDAVVKKDVDGVTVVVVAVVVVASKGIEFANPNVVAAAGVGVEPNGALDEPKGFVGAVEVGVGVVGFGVGGEEPNVMGVAPKGFAEGVIEPKGLLMVEVEEPKGFADVGVEANGLVLL